MLVSHDSEALVERAVQASRSVFLVCWGGTLQYLRGVALIRTKTMLKNWRSSWVLRAPDSSRNDRHAGLRAEILFVFVSKNTQLCAINNPLPISF